MDTEKLLAECILVRILGHAGWILMSYLHDLGNHDIQTCYHGIQTCYQGGRGLRIFNSLFGCCNTQNCRVTLFNSSQIHPDGSKMLSALSSVYHR
jgi:hypothetical protein